MEWGETDTAGFSDVYVASGRQRAPKGDSILLVTSDSWACVARSRREHCADGLSSNFSDEVTSVCRNYPRKRPLRRALRGPLRRRVKS